MTFGHMGKVASALAICISGLVTATAKADTGDNFKVTYLGAGVQTPTGITSYYENFNNVVLSDGTVVTTYGGSPVTGTYSGNFSLANAGQYGGAGGTGKYITTPSAGADTLALNHAVNYFGLWFSALDNGNELQFYKNSALVYTFSAQDFIDGVGSCSTPNPYCGNPNSGQNSNQQYAYINFYDLDGTFDEIHFMQSSGGGFESDNHSAANVTGPTVGTSLAPVPEPSSLMLLGTGALGLAGAVRRRLRS